MSAHTPGPWDIGKHSDGKVVMAGTGDDRVRVADCRSPEQHEEETERANARLIAAAPDLLAACEEVLAAHNGANGRSIGKVIPIVRAAVLRAKGKS